MNPLRVTLYTRRFIPSYSTLRLQSFNNGGSISWSSNPTFPSCHSTDKFLAWPIADQALKYGLFTSAVRLCLQNEHLVIPHVQRTGANDVITTARRYWILCSKRLITVNWWVDHLLNIFVHLLILHRKKGPFAEASMLKLEHADNARLLVPTKLYVQFVLSCQQFLYQRNGLGVLQEIIH